MLGAIIGDVAGSIYEVNEINNNKFKRIDYDGRLKALNRLIPLFDKNSSYTDDTVLTAAVAYAILEKRDYGEVLKEFGLHEKDLGLDKYGRNRFGRGFSEWVNGDYIGESYGNGCAMRISPVANYYNDIETILEEANKATYPSHNHVDSYDAVNAVCTCIYLAKTKTSKEKIQQTIENMFYDLNFNLNDLQKKYSFTSKAIDSVPQAIYCFLISKDFEDAIRKAISIGGDSDTIAAITGSIAEAYYGIPDDLIAEVKQYLPNYIIDIINDFYFVTKGTKPFNSIKVKSKSILL